MSYELGKSPYTVQECLIQGLSFAAPLRIKVKLVLFDRETNFEEVLQSRYKAYPHDILDQSMILFPSQEIKHYK